MFTSARSWFIGVVSSLSLLAAVLAARPALQSDSTTIDCGDHSTQYSSTSLPVSGSGTTQVEALADLYGNGMTNDFAGEQDATCELCVGTPCEMTSDFSGTISGIHYLYIRNQQGTIIWVIALANFTGTYTLYCDPC